MDNINMQNILDHFKDPDNYGELSNFTHVYELKNLSCGDSIKVFLLVEDDKVSKVSFLGSGCAISQAAMSILTSEITAMTLDELRKLDSAYIKELLGIKLGPTRLKCATLGLESIRKALQ